MDHPRVRLDARDDCGGLDEFVVGDVVAQPATLAADFEHSTDLPADAGNQFAEVVVELGVDGSGADEGGNDGTATCTVSPCAFPLLDWSGHADAVVQFTVPAFEYPRSDAPATLHFAGPISATGSHAPQPNWWGDLDGRRPVIHVTQGTIANKDFTQLVGPTLEALVDDDVLVVVSTGGRPLDTLPPLPANARAAEYLPYDELLPRTDVFVTNGGYGGVQYALRYGVPIVTTGGKEDKPEVGGRIMWSGVGRRIRTERPRPRQLRRAIHDVLHQPRYRDASRRIAADMARAPGLDGLTSIIDSLTAPAAATDNSLSALTS